MTAPTTKKPRAKSRKPWVMPTHKLCFPITVDADEGGEATITEIVLRPFSVIEHRKALATVSDDVEAQFEALLALATGYDEDVIDKIKRPDFVSLGAILNDYIKLPASFYLERLPEDPDVVPLLVPIKGVMGQITSLTLEVPALKATKIMQKMKGDYEPADFISAHCAGLSVTEIHMLSCPDWTQLQERVDSFLNKPADYFQTATLK